MNRSTSVLISIDTPGGRSDNAMKDAVADGHTFHVSQDDFFPQPAKEDVVSQPVKA